MRYHALLWLLFGGLLSNLSSGPSQELVRAFLWPQSHKEFLLAKQALDTDASLVGVSRGVMDDVEEWIRAGKPAFPALARGADGHFPLQQFSVRAPGGAPIPVLIRLPSSYRPEKGWPLLLAMHGGPVATAARARRGALSMLQVWARAAERAGWIVAAPAMTTALASGPRTRERLAYEVFQPEIARAVLDAVTARFHVDPDRLVATGISLGSNFSIAFAAAHPDWFSAIVPVSTEGDSREHLLRNLWSTPVYVLEGALDRNIRGVSGPRAMAEILTNFGYALKYREFKNRSHEGFQEHYDDVLRWLSSRPRRSHPKEILRVPHEGIMPTARRVFWIKCDTRQGFVRARVKSPHRIEIQTYHVRRVTLYLHDDLVDLDRPISVVINGNEVFSGKLQRSVALALQEVRRLHDPGRISSARLDLEVPDTPSARALGDKFQQSLSPVHPEGQLSYWEMYAARALKERFAGLGCQGKEEALPAGAGGTSMQVGVRLLSVSPESPLARAGLEAGDLLVTFGGEPFFARGGALAGLESWLRRELRATPRDNDLLVWRGGQAIKLTVRLALGPYRPAQKEGR